MTATTGKPLHTKYRPAVFDDVIGQGHIIPALQNAMQSNQVFLFEGPSGTGKTTLARITANHIECEEVDEVDAASNTGVEAMRTIARRADFRPLGGGNRAIIVDECHRLSKQAWDSLLKDIEEPPAGVYWFFCTTELHKVPATIKTRCMTFSLHDVSYRAIHALLERVAQAEGFTIPDEILKLAASESGGSVRQGLVNLATVQTAADLSSAQAALNHTDGAKQAYDLSRALMTGTWDYSSLLKLCTELKEVDPEGVRIQVFAYAQSAALGGNNWAFHVMGAFEKPAEPTNRIGDILLRIGRLNAKKNK